MSKKKKNPGMTVQYLLHNVLSLLQTTSVMLVVQWGMSKVGRRTVVTKAARIGLAGGESRSMRKGDVIQQQGVGGWKTVLY